MTIAWSVDTQGLCLKTDLFSDLPYRSYVSGENGPQKRNFSKMLSRVEIFENAHFSFTCGRTKLVGFRIRCDDIMCIIASSILLVWRMLRKGCYSISIVLAFSRVQAKTIPIRYIWIRISKCADEASVFTKQGENISVNVVCNRAFFVTSFPPYWCPKQWRKNETPAMSVFQCIADGHVRLALTMFYTILTAFLCKSCCPLAN